MRLGLYANSSPTLGAGHVMRQLGIAHDAASRGVEVFLIGSISGSPWLKNRVKALEGLTWIETSLNLGTARELLELQLDAAVLDSYALSRPDISLLEEHIGRVAAIVDGPWQDVAGRLGIAPVIDPRAPWLEDVRRRFDEFFVGPEFVAIRKEVRALDNLRVRGGANVIPEVVVALGGTDLGGHTRWVLEALCQVPRPLSIKVFSSDWQVLEGLLASTHHRLQFLEPGEDFLEALPFADIVVSALGTTALELAFLRIPAVFIPVARNQEVNAAAAADLEVGCLVDPNDADRATHLVDAVGRILSSPPSTPEAGLMGLDGLGACRIVDILLN